MLLLTAVMGVIDTIFVSALGVNALAAIGPPNTVFNTMAILFTASLAAAATKTVALGLGLREKHVAKTGE